MTQSDRAALHVYLLVRNAQFLHPCHRHGSERFVALEQVDVADRHARLLQRVLRRRNGAGQHPHRVGGTHRQVVNAGARLEAVFLHRLFRGDQHGSGGVAVLAGDTGGDHAAFVHRLQACQHFQRGASAYGLVGGEIAVGGNLALEPAVLDRFMGAAVRFNRERFHGLARDVPLVGDHLGGLDLVHFLGAVAGVPALCADERALEAVLLAHDHGGGNGNAVHGLRAACHHQILRAGHHALSGEVHSLLRGAALAVDGHARHFLRHACNQPCGAADVASLTANGIAAAPHHVVNVGGVNLGALHQRLDRVRSEVRRVQMGKAALLAANGGANSVNNISFRHFLPRGRKSGPGRAAG